MRAQRNIVLLGLTGLFSASSCTTRLDPMKIGNLPQSSGIYAGSQIWVYDAWVYRGTDERGHHLTYSWYRNNIANQRNLIVSASAVSVSEEFNLSKERPVRKLVKPSVDESGRLIAFKIIR